MISIEDKNIYRKLFLINSIRISILSVLTVLTLFIHFIISPSVSLLPIIFFLIIAIGFSILNLFISRRLKLKMAIYIQVLLDIAIITAIVYFSGGIVSPFYFLYILPIVTSANFLSKKDTIYIATLSYIIFGILCDLVYLKIIPFYLETSEFNISFGSLIYNLIISFFAFSGIALLASHYFERIKKTGAELKNVRENLRELLILNSTVMEKMENGFIIANSQGMIISYNKVAKEMLKFTNNSNVFDILKLIGSLDKVMESVEKNRKYYFEVELKNYYIGVTLSSLEKIYSFNKIYVFVMTDLTEKKEIETKLLQKEHFALIGEMAAGIAHELRNPLASISGSVQFLKTEMKLEPGYQNLMNIIVKESKRLSVVIEEFLEYSKISPLKKIEFDLSEQIDEIVKLLLVNNPELEIKKKYQRDIILFADQKRMKQLLWNVLTNAVKAVNKKGIIEVSVYNKNNQLFLSIKDNGIGIDPENISKIFYPFYSQFSSGIGLGMLMVKQVVNEHNFEIKIISEKNIGTEVIICLKTK